MAGVDAKQPWRPPVLEVSTRRSPGGWPKNHREDGVRQWEEFASEAKPVNRRRYTY